MLLNYNMYNVTGWSPDFYLTLCINITFYLWLYYFFIHTGKQSISKENKIGQFWGSILNTTIVLVFWFKVAITLKVRSALTVHYFGLGWLRDLSFVFSFFFFYRNLLIKGPFYVGWNLRFSFRVTPPPTTDVLMHS